MTKRALPCLGALFGPFVIASIYLWFSRWPDRSWTAASDYLALVVSIVGGLLALWSLPMSVGRRAVVSVIYVPVMGALLIYWALGFVCIVFGNCL